MWEQVWNTGNLAALDEMVAPEATLYVPGNPQPMDRESWKGFYAPFYAAFPGLRLTIDDLIAEEDKVVVRFTFQGTHQGELMGIPPTGKDVRAGGITIVRIAGGKMVEHWEEFDMLGILQQLGVVPPPGQGGG
jgi:steroid delta-isomerase-like uncharacterized protein